MKQEKENSNLSKIRDEMERRLIIMRYSPETIKAYMRIVVCVEEYLEEYGEPNYTKEIGQRFLSEYSLQPDHSPLQFRHVRTVIKRIDDILGNKQFEICFRHVKSECPSRFIGLLDKYINNLVKREYSNHTIKSRRSYTERFLGLLPETILSLEELTAAHLYEVFTKGKWPPVGLLIIKYFLLFLFANKAIKTNLSHCVPKPARPSPLPSVYSGDDVQRLLSSVDRTTGLGKRDYAVLILAANMGLRSSDIVNLSFKNIDHAAKKINIIQVKTANQSTFVMNNEVEEAITDYTQNGRPKSSSEKIFLRSHAPFTPLTAGNCYMIANKYFKLAGIALQGRKSGTHALRASYATALVSKGVPYAVVQKALGHEEPESAKYYVRVDAKRLRMCALDVPKPMGALAVMLESDVRQALGLREPEGVLA